LFFIVLKRNEIFKTKRRRTAGKPADFKETLRNLAEKKLCKIIDYETLGQKERKK